jgi:hypothetical protein
MLKNQAITNIVKIYCAKHILAWIIVQSRFFRVFKTKRFERREYISILDLFFQSTISASHKI